MKPLGDPELDIKLHETVQKAAHDTYGLYTEGLEKRVSTEIGFDVGRPVQLKPKVDRCTQNSLA